MIGIYARKSTQRGVYTRISPYAPTVIDGCMNV